MRRLFPSAHAASAVDRARLVGIAIALAGLLLALGARAAWPEPRWLDDLDAGDPLPSRVLARGPGIARYDAADDSTLALFECSHAPSCPIALALRGDARAAVASDGVLLRPLSGGAATTMAFDPPLAPRYGEPVATRYASDFEVVPRLPGAVARLLGVGLALAGAALALGSWRGAAGAAASALVVAAGFTTGDGGAVILLQLAGVPLSLLLAGGLFVAARTRPWAAAPAMYLPVVIIAFLSGATAFFPMDGP